MSKNHPHDNIYNILSKLKSLEPTPADVVKERAQQIRESVESQGSILKGLREVSDVEQRLTRQFAESNFSKLSGKIQKSGKSKASADAISASIGREKLGQAEMTRRSVAGKKHAHEGVAENAKPDYIDLDKDGNKKESMKKASADKKKKESTNKSMAECAMCEAGTCTEHGVAEDTVHKGTYGTSYDPSDEGKKTKTKHVPKAGQKGRPKQDKPTDTKSAPRGDIFGRTTGEVPKGKKGTKIKGKDNIDTVDEAAKWRNPEYKGKFYTQKKGDSDDYDSIDYGYGIPERPKKDPGQKRRMGGIGDEWEVTDKLSTGHMDTGNTTGGAHWAGTGGSTDMKDWKPSPYKDSNVTKRGPRKGFITKSGINTVKDRIKGALGQHHSPVLPEGADYKKQNFIVESFNFAEMMKETDQTVQEMLTELQNDIQAFKTTGECTPKLDAFLRVHGHTSNKKKLSDAAPVPYEVPAVQRRAAGTPPLTPQAVQQQDAERSMHPPKLDAPKPAVYDELDELAKLSGITDEGNAYGLATRQTPPGEEIMIHGEPTGEIKHEDAMQDQAGVSLNELAKLAGLKVESNDDWHDSLDGEHENPDGWEDDSDMAGEEETTPGGNTFTYVFDENNNTTKFVYTDANGQSQSFEIYYDSTARGFDPHEVHDATDPKHQTAALGNQIITHDDMPEIIDRLIAAPTGVNEANAPVAEPDEEPINNAHRVKYQSMKASTMGPGEGDAGEKTMHPDRPTFKNGDNPLATPARNESTIKLEARLAREYESIKKKA